MDDGVSPMWGMIILVGIIVIDFLLYGFTAAVENLGAADMEKLEKEGDARAALLLNYQDKPERYMNICRLLVLVLHMLLGFFEISLWKRQLFGETQNPALSFFSYLAVFLLLLFPVLILGVYTAEKVAARKPKSFALFLVRPVHILELVFSPVIFLTNAAANLLARVFGVDPFSETDDVTEEEIISMVREGHEQGVLLASEAEMIHNIFEFGDKEAKDIMTHRKNMVVLDGNRPFEEVLHFIEENGHSRFPVYVDEIDNIIGILHIREALLFGRRTELFGMPVKDIEGLVHSVEFIPETRNINTLFTMMQSKKQHMVVVVDEYGQTSGIVAMEDILEEIVGNIEDEHDKEEHMIEKNPDGSFLMNGMADFSDVIKELKIEPDEEENDDFETLNGFLISLIDKIPGDDELFSVEVHGYRFEVLSVENKMIQTVRVTPTVEESESANEPEPVAEQTQDAPEEIFSEEAACSNAEEVIE